MPKVSGKDHHWYGIDNSREKNGHWKGGCYINDAGYVMIYDPDHKRASSNGYVREHIIIAEKALGKELPVGSQIHHMGDTGDNSKIVICENQEYHYLIHARQAAMEVCGDPNKRKCKFCKEYDFIENMYCKQCPPYGWNIYHRSCNRIYDRQRSRKMR